jgi:phage/plasmid-like protein (TIGR03299 family)
MSETIEHRNTAHGKGSIIWRGFSEAGGTIWADEAHRYSGAIPLERVRDDLFGWSAVEGSVSATYLSDDGVTTIDAPEHKAIVRSDTNAVLAIHGKGYTIHQFSDWTLEVVQPILGADLQIAGAGLFRNGGVAFVQVEMPETQQVHGVEYRPFLNIGTSHDGSLSTTYNFGSTLLVCSNMMGSAMSGGLRVRHTINSHTRIPDIQAALGGVQAEAAAFGHEIDRLANITVTDAQWQRFVEAHTGLGREGASQRSQSIAERKARDLNFMWNNDEMVNGFKGTAFGVVQAVSTTRHHLDTVRGAARGERNVMNVVMGAHAASDAKTMALLESVLA